MIDEFYYKQPPLQFIDALRAPVHQKAPSGFGKRAKDNGEVDARGMYIDAAFPDKNRLLETAYEDFSRFSDIYGISGNSYAVRTEYGETDCYEAYSIEIGEDRCVIRAADAEGIRRALIHLEGEIESREAAYLPLGKIKRKPFIKTRITRGFFSPTNRPPKNGDELFDDIDYYPDEYLNRLAHDGTNGIWIYTSWRALLTSRYFPEYGEGSEKRLEKLRAVVKKCARYGIKVYVFAIEPFNLTHELATNHPEVLGAKSSMNTVYPVCPSTDVGREYILEASEKLFRLVPELSGYIDITFGERWTSCVSAATFHTCPRCSKKPRGVALAEVASLIQEGIRRAGTGAEFISWTYGHRLWEHDDIREYVRNTDPEVCIMQNFEDMGYPEQLGKTRIAVDYWLSYVGPSPMFRITAEEAAKRGAPMYAKLQVCCSHELATVPYIPTPGILFDKYKAAAELGVCGIVQCWYFGNYPSLMNRAAGELSFMEDEDFQNKDAFLLRLASILYGRTHAKEIATAWKLFEEGYVNYPVNVMFSYYGPIHDGVVWKLQLKPKDKCLPRSWQLLDCPDGDRIHECLWEGHTLDEAIILCERMKLSWSEGMKHLECLKGTELYTLSAAIGLLFDSGYNILNFYRLRDELGEYIGSPSDILDEMEGIVNREIENSTKMIALCEADCRLGYHSEAEGFKFFPEKLNSRIEWLRELMKTEFAEVRERMERGLAPLEFYLAEKDGKPIADAYEMSEGDIECANDARIADTESYVRISYDDDNLYLRLRGKRDTVYSLFFEFRLNHPTTDVSIDRTGVKVGEYGAQSHQSVFGSKLDEVISLYDLTKKEDADETVYDIVISREKAKYTYNTPIRIRLEAREAGINEKIANLKPGERAPRYVWTEYDGEVICHLGKPFADPVQYKWLIPVL